jgi:hypothetical protein
VRRSTASGRAWPMAANVRGTVLFATGTDVLGLGCADGDRATSSIITGAVFWRRPRTLIRSTQSTRFAGPGQTFSAWPFGVGGQPKRRGAETDAPQFRRGFFWGFAQAVALGRAISVSDLAVESDGRGYRGGSSVD